MEKQKKKLLAFIESHQQLDIIFVAVLAVLLISGGVMYKVLSLQFKQVVESPRTEMKRIPLDVRRAMAKPIPTQTQQEQKLSKMQNHIASLSATIRVPILLYHYIEYVQDKKDKIRQSLNINPNVFDLQLQTLKNAGYTFLTAKELGEILDGNMQLPQNPILITIDDGHWDVDTDILPILKKYQVKATAYIIPGFTGGSDFMTQQQVQDVINSGLVDIGAHTVHHIGLKGKLLPVVQYEVDQSKTMLEQTYHIHVVSFAYPNGFFDQQAIQVVKDAGFTTAVSTIPGVEQNQQNRFFLFRIRPGVRTGPTLLTYLQQTTYRAY